MTKSTYILLVVLTIFFACEKVVELDIDQSAPQIVIEGLLTNEDTVHYVKVSRSIQFYDVGLNPVTDAVVKVTGNGMVYTYSHNPSSSDSLNGFYFSDMPYAGVIGKSYSLQVDVGGINYIANDTIRYITKVDSLSFQLALNPSDDEKERGELYQVLLFASEPQETDDFYYFQFFRNDTLITSLTEIYAFSDEALGTALDGLPSPVLFKENEMAGVKMYSLTREQYVFYTDLDNLLNTDGGMFSPPPANPRNTFTNGALGLWQVSAVSEGSIRINP